MKVYIARQPIFDRNRELYAYELLYRSNKQNAYDASVEGSRATRNLLSDVLTVFRLPSLTNQHFAFINFTKELLLQKLPKILNPQDVVVEILEDVIPDDDLIECVKDLKNRNFKIALDDYCGPGPIDALFPYADIIKVDFSLVDETNRKELAKSLSQKVPHAKLLAEKIETEEEYERAKDYGYSYFQGYYFSKPVMFSKTSLEIVDHTGMELLKEINKSSPSYSAMADIIKKDVGMTYAMIKQMNSLGSYRGNTITNIKDALIRMGMEEIRKWTMLKLIRTITDEHQKESVRLSLVRAEFAENIAQELGWNKLKDGAFMIGMFSIIDPEVNDDIIALLEETKAFQDVKEALLGSDNELRRILMFVKVFEDGRWDEIKEIFEVKINAERVADLYVKAVSYADEIFNVM